MTFDFNPLVPCELPQFKQDLQEAFQLGAEAFFGAGAGPVLPASHIDAALAAPGARAWKAAVDGAMAGGAVVSASGDSGSLDFLYVRHGIQSRGIGRRIWTAIEQAYTEVRVWETCTPWFDKRNIHFYINVCDFAAVEFFCAKHPDPHMPDVSDGSGEDCMFRFVKRLGMH